MIDLTGLEVANASLLDEATAAAEAMTLCHSLKDDRTAFFVSDSCHPQTIDVIKTRAEALEKHYLAVLAEKPLLVWGDVTNADLEFLLTRLPHRGLAVNVVVNSVEEAHAIWETAMLLQYSA